MPGITIQIMGDGAGATEALRQIEAKMQETAKRGDQMSEQMAAAGRRIMEAFSVVGLIEMARRVAEEIKRMVEQSIELGTELGHLSEKTGISVQDLSALKFAGEETGVSFESLQKGVKKLAVAMYDAESGKRTAIANFKNLGVSTEELRKHNGDLYGMLGLIADKFKEMPDGPIKLAEAQKLFGKSGLDLIPILNEGSEAIDEYRAKAANLGLILDENTTAKMKGLHRSIVEMKGAWSGLALEITSDLAPALKGLADELSGILQMLHASPGQTFLTFLGAGLSAASPGSGVGSRLQMAAVAKIAELQRQQVEAAKSGKKPGAGVDGPEDDSAARDAERETAKWAAIVAKWNSMHSQGMRAIIDRSHEILADQLADATAEGKKAWDAMATDAAAAVNKAFEKNPPQVKLETESQDPLGNIDQSGAWKSDAAYESANVISGFMDNFVSQAARGKISFKSLVDSAISDLARWAMRVMEEKALIPALNAMFGMGGGSNLQFGDSGNVSSVNGLSPGVIAMAGGGDIPAGGMAIVGDSPSGDMSNAELFAPKGPGSVLPHDVLKGLAAGRGGGGAPSVQIMNVNNSSQAVDMKHGGTSFDADARAFIIHTVLEDAASGGPVAGMLGGFQRG